MGNYDKYDLLRCEFFEYLLPGLVYGGTQEEQIQLIETLEADGSGLIHDLFDKLCKEDGVEYPYTGNDFKVNVIERGGIHYIQICLPGYNSEINDVLRAYILYTHERKSGKQVHWKYFLVKRFWNGGIINILYVDHQGERWLEDKVLQDTKDMEYEYQNLAKEYLRMLILEVQIILSSI